MTFPSMPPTQPPMPSTKAQLDAAVANRRHDLTRDFQRSHGSSFGWLRRLVRRVR